MSATLVKGQNAPLAALDVLIGVQGAGVAGAEGTGTGGVGGGCAAALITPVRVIRTAASTTATVAAVVRQVRNAHSSRAGVRRARSRALTRTGRRPKVHVNRSGPVDSGDPQVIERIQDRQALHFERSQLPRIQPCPFQKTPPSGYQ